MTLQEAVDKYGTFCTIPATPIEEQALRAHSRARDEPMLKMDMSREGIEVEVSVADKITVQGIPFSVVGLKTQDDRVREVEFASYCLP